MTLIVKGTHTQTMTLPVWVMRQLHVHEGEEVKMTIEDDALRLTPLEQFLALRGAWREDDACDQALTYLDQAWQAWTAAPSTNF